MYGFLIYLPTIAFVPHYAFLLPVLYYISKNYKTLWNKKFSSYSINTNLFLITLIVILCFLNRLYAYEKIEAITDLFPFTFLLFVTYFIAVNFRHFDLQVLVFLITIECFVVFAEYLSGVNTFFTSFDNYSAFNYSSGLFYDRTAFGLSYNSSTISQKIVLGFILSDLLKINKLYSIILKSFFLVALFMTFNRSALLAVLLYIILIYLSEAKSVYLDLLLMKIKRNKIFFFISSITLMLLAGIFVLKYFSSIIGQVTRNRNSLELSGRELIWDQYINFIWENWILGNNSFKYYITLEENYMLHAHNSYLQLIATHGIIITILYFIFIFRNVNGRNSIFICVILFYSLSQYGVFWGISLMDTIMFILLINPFIFYNKNHQLDEKKSQEEIIFQKKNLETL